MELILPTIEHKQAALEYRQEHTESGESSIHGSAGFIHADSYESWLEKITSAQTAASAGNVTATTYFAVAGGRIVGTISIRHYLNDALLKNGGHIGYGVRPTERRKGYGSAMLALALQKCRDFGISKALVTCDKDNTASAKTIIKNGGILWDELTEENGGILQRYWIAVTKNLIIINGAPGMGKTTVCEELAKILPRNIYLDCDCFMWANPYVVTEETERIRYDNIIYTTKNHLSCTEYDNIIINWVFTSQRAIDRILTGLDLADVTVHVFSLTCRADIWKERMENDNINQKRKIQTTYEKWTKRIADGYYQGIAAKIIDTSDITAEQTAEMIANVVTK